MPVHTPPSARDPRWGASLSLIASLWGVHSPSFLRFAPRADVMDKGLQVGISV